MACTIVAIPAKTSHIWDISSEEIPHMTILYLGDVSLENEVDIVQYVRHAAATGLTEFDLYVDRRGNLGPDEADVLFFEKSSALNTLETFRSHLLANDKVKAAYDSVDQYPKWTPHLTLGYPGAPAKLNKQSEVPYWVEFDTIAIWTDNFDGPEIQLDKNSASYDGPDAYQSAIGNLEWFEILNDEESLAHFGVLGMKWGVRRRTGPDGLVRGTVADAAKKSGVDLDKPRTGKMSADHKRAIDSLVKKNTEGVESLSDRELKEVTTRLKAIEEFNKALSPKQKSDLQEAVDRLKLEKEHDKLSAEKAEAAKGTVRRLVDQAIKSAVNQVAKDPIGTAERIQRLVNQAQGQKGGAPKGASPKRASTNKSSPGRRRAIEAQVYNITSKRG